MGTLKPGATYVYERVDNTVYAREFGKTERTIVGYDYKRDPLDHRNYMSDPIGSQLWHDIRRAAMDHEDLRKVLERAKILYYLKYGHENKQDTLDW